MAEAAGRDVRVILVTVPDLEEGKRIARAVVEERLAACVNLVPGVLSVYRWQEGVEEAGEVLLVMKGTADGFEPLRARVVELHPYDTPEVLALPVPEGDERYLAWLRAGVGSER